VKTRIYHDWEFVEDGRTVVPLSVALKADNGDELYRIFRDEVVVGRALADPWLRHHVVRHLPVRVASDVWNWDVSHPDYPKVRTRAQIEQDVRFFVAKHGTGGLNGVELWGDYVAYDHVCMAQLFGRMMDLPLGFPMFTKDLRQEIDRLGLSTQPDLLPRQDSATEHSALCDVRHEKQLGDFLLNYESNQADYPQDYGR